MNKFKTYIARTFWIVLVVIFISAIFLGIFTNESDALCNRNHYPCFGRHHYKHHHRIHHHKSIHAHISSNSEPEINFVDEQECSTNNEEKIICKEMTPKEVEEMELEFSESEISEIENILKQHTELEAENGYTFEIK
jgi:hypothetical protein